MKRLLAAGFVAILATLVIGLSSADAWGHRRGRGNCGGGAGGSYAAPVYSGGCSGMTAGYVAGGGAYGYAWAGTGANNLAFSGSYDGFGNPIMVAVAAPAATNGAVGAQPGQRLPGGAEESSERRGNKGTGYPPGSVWRADENGNLRRVNPDAK